MKRGDKVFVCHDGKWGRRIVGVVIKQHNGHHITVQFEMEKGIPIVTKFRKEPAIHYKRNCGCFFYMKRPAHYSGWANIDYFSPWFAVYKYKEQTK